MQTLTEYHHASSQTDPCPRGASDVLKPKFHRETQTAVMQTRSQQSVSDSQKQMFFPPFSLVLTEGAAFAVAILVPFIANVSIACKNMYVLTGS